MKVTLALCAMLAAPAAWGQLPPCPEGQVAGPNGLVCTGKCESGNVVINGICRPTWIATEVISRPSVTLDDARKICDKHIAPPLNGMGEKVLDDRDFHECWQVFELQKEADLTVLKAFLHQKEPK